MRLQNNLQEAPKRPTTRSQHTYKRAQTDNRTTLPKLVHLTSRLEAFLQRPDAHIRGRSSGPGPFIQRAPETLSRSTLGPSPWEFWTSGPVGGRTKITWERETGKETGGRREGRRRRTQEEEEGTKTDEEQDGEKEDKEGPKRGTHSHGD